MLYECILYKNLSLLLNPYREFLLISQPWNLCLFVSQFQNSHISLQSFYIPTNFLESRIGEESYYLFSLTFKFQISAPPFKKAGLQVSSEIEIAGNYVPKKQQVKIYKLGFFFLFLFSDFIKFFI